MFFDVLACYHWLISTKHKVKLTLMGISFVLQMFGYKTTNRTNDNFDLMMVQPHGHALRSPSPHDTSSGNHECLLKILCQSTPDVLYKHTKKTHNSQLQAGKSHSDSSSGDQDFLRTIWWQHIVQLLNQRRHTEQCWRVTWAMNLWTDMSLTVWIGLLIPSCLFSTVNVFSFRRRAC